MGKVFLATAAFAALLTAGQPLAASANTAVRSEALIDAGQIEAARNVLNREIVSRSLAIANADRRDLSQAQIDAYDTRWRAEREARSKPLIARTLMSPLSNYLTRIQAHSGGLYTEIFVTGRHGLNVGQSAETSDMWQGDEAKYQRTFAEGAGRVFIDEAEWHEASRTWRAQLNITVDDPDGGAPLGAATFELNLTELLRRAAP